MRLSHLTLPVSDIPRARAFYLGLGLTLIVDSPHYCRFLARLDESGEGDETLSIEAVEGRVDRVSQIGFEFASAGALDAFCARLAASGLAVEGPVDRAWLWRDARLTDPDGHELMFFHAGKNKLDPPWRVR